MITLNENKGCVADKNEKECYYPGMYNILSVHV